MSDNLKVTVTVTNTEGDKILYGPFDTMTEAIAFVFEGRADNVFDKGIKPEYTYLNSPNLPRFTYRETANIPSDKVLSGTFGGA
jgi:hypothetical protein